MGQRGEASREALKIASGSPGMAAERPQGVIRFRVVLEAGAAP